MYSTKETRERGTGWDEGTTFGGWRGIWGSGDLGIWGSGDLGIWGSGDLGGRGRFGRAQKKRDPGLRRGLFDSD